MLNSLDDAWRWYQDTQQLVQLQRRMARYWDELPWEGAIGREAMFIDVRANELRNKGDFSLTHLDDLAIVVLFSVFESLVRQRVLADVSLEEASLQHRAIKLAVSAAKEHIEYGSFFRVLEPFKDHHHDLVAQVDQVREYRNWVAHGSRGLPTNRVDPRTAYARLKAFLKILEGQADVEPPSS